MQFTYNNKKNELKHSLLPEDKHLLSTSWISYLQEGSFEKFSPVVRLILLRIIIALSIHRHLLLHTQDVDTFVSKSSEFC